MKFSDLIVKQLISITMDMSPCSILSQPLPCHHKSKTILQYIGNWTFILCHFIDNGFGLWLHMTQILQALQAALYTVTNKNLDRQNRWAVSKWCQNWKSLPLSHINHIQCSQTISKISDDARPISFGAKREAHVIPRHETCQKTWHYLHRSPECTYHTNRYIIRLTDSYRMLCGERESTSTLK